MRDSSALRRGGQRDDAPRARAEPDECRADDREACDGGAYCREASDPAAGNVVLLCQLDEVIVFVDNHKATVDPRLSGLAQNLAWGRAWEARDLAERFTLRFGGMIRFHLFVPIFTLALHVVQFSASDVTRCTITYLRRTDDRGGGKSLRDEYEATRSEETEDDLIAAYDYHLPSEFIAQTPVEPRDSSRLLVLHRQTGAIEHRTFRDIGSYLDPGDLLVANQSKVLPARLHGVKEPTGGHIEILLLAARPDLGVDCWEALARPGRRLHEGQRLNFGDGALTAEVLSRTTSGERLLRLTPQEGTIEAALLRIGETPLPPYIRAPLADASRYQTVYARAPGSAAAPTAGLHFTPALLEKLRARGVNLAFVTLHIGLDTFRPVGEARLTDHKMHSEVIALSAETAELINVTRAQGRRVIAVGTTSVRTLEAAAQRAESLRAEGALAPDASVAPMEGRTDIFIQPGYRFRAVDALITNFHLPRSTLIVLVSAFAGRDLILHAYEEAVREGYRFYSFGDAMLIL
jgi:S-adenosylmethionine:tRNA ribosyltransferase-isomerase